MADIQNHYEADEFDQLAAVRQTYGAHRAYRRKYGWALAIILILVLAPAAGVLGGQLLVKSAALQNENTATSSTQQSERNESATEDSEKAKDSDESIVDEKDSAKNTEPQDKPTQSTAPSPATPATPTVKLETPVKVLNASGIKGLARDKTQILRNAGFTKLTTDNYRGRGLTSSTVFYADDSLADTAKKVAAELGIQAVEKRADIAQAGSITAVLLSR